MRYISNTPAQQKEMLGLIGVSSIEDLLVRIPAKARLSRPLNLPSALAEIDLVRLLRRMSGENAAADDYACFLGAGSCDHAIPSPINHLISRGEFIDETLIIEPTERESKKTLDQFCDAMIQIAREAESTPQVVHDAPVTTPARRLDQTLATRQPRLRWTP